MQRLESCEQAGEAWAACEESREAEFDCAQGFPEVRKITSMPMMYEGRRAEFVKVSEEIFAGRLRNFPSG